MREALEAAHIRVHDGADDHASGNGILLRRDIHGLFDALLFTFSPDGTKVEISKTLANSRYCDLRNAKIARPVDGSPPSRQNIADHRKRFREKKLA
ncbi:HNH endonuclease signature motif containing protein [Novacetimonas pomaceti]|uniref:HNH endonuclease signature motif containing protein n=1 Tax=Novacetimonas pomaceti TaxID=2021998 RepID=UPI0014024A2F|nr:HNH endonuclease signature motif containing protein [Novacetimonas pomaceti]